MVVMVVMVSRGRVIHARTVAADGVERKGKQEKKDTSHNTSTTTEVSSIA